MKVLMLAILAGVLVVSGCAGKGKKNGADGSSLGLGGSGASTTPLGQGRGIGSGAGSAYGPGSRAAPGSPLSKTVIYFDYDSETMAPSYEEVVRAHAGYLGSNPGQKVRLAGHSDERGSREYNLSLAERRALSVQRAFMLNGAQRSQIEAISYGEEVPASLGHDEESWQLNRRVVIEYVGQ